MSLKRSIEKAYKTAQERNWNKIYVLVDLHDTVAKSNYKDTSVDFYPEAISALQKLSLLKEVHLVLWSCSFPDDCQKYIDRLAEHSIVFKSINTTPVENTKTGCFDVKPYFSVLIDDKAGFDPNEWPLVVSDFNYYRLMYNLF